MELEKIDLENKSAFDRIAVPTRKTTYCPPNGFCSRAFGSDGARSIF